MSTAQPTEFNLFAGIASIVCPGAGHFVLGQRSRGVFAFVGVMGLFFFGLLLGGVDAVDSQNDKVWYYGQLLAGPPTLIVDTIHQSRFKAYDYQSNTVRSGFPDEQRVFEGDRYVWKPLTQAQIESGLGPPNTPGLGRLNEIAMLSIVLAGMLNLIIFLDALLPNPKHAPLAPQSGESNQ